MPKASIESLFKKNEKKALADFFTFLKFQSISTDPVYVKETKACADWLAAYLKDMGFTVELWPTSRHPVVFASYTKAGKDKPTLLIYNHYDVQPVDPLNLWKNSPFEPTLKAGEIYARGAQDNKGQCFYTIQALKLLLERDGTLPINIKLCIEGEEECGSEGLSVLLEQKRKQLKADYLAIVDVGIPDKHTPTLTLGLRGIVTMDIEVTASKIDLHSGSHGGVAYNANRALVELLAGLRDANGKITIPGFYDDVVAVSNNEKAKLNNNFDEKAYLEQFGVVPTGGETAFQPIERLWFRPAIEINGISGGYTGSGFKTVIPAKAHAKMSCRIVPNQEPQKVGQLIAKYLKSHAPKGVSVAVDVHPGGGKAVRANSTSKIVKAFEQAFSEVFEKPCSYIYEGASIPIVTELAAVSKSQLVLVGLGLPDDQIHAPNEHFGWDRFQQGVRIITRAIEHLS